MFTYSSIQALRRVDYKGKFTYFGNILRTPRQHLAYPITLSFAYPCPALSLLAAPLSVASGGAMRSDSVRAWQTED
jgi:hypothetical protein